MVSFLLTETMSGRHELSLQSYDRLFPSQDTLPRGGFGNLIALRQTNVVRMLAYSGIAQAPSWKFLVPRRRFGAIRLA